MKKLWNRILTYLSNFVRGGKTLMYVAWASIKSEVVDLLNDTELQGLALEAVRNAAKAKLQGDEAWAQAFDEFKKAALARGKNVGTAVLETILQNVYLVFKYTEALPEGKE